MEAVWVIGAGGHAKVAIATLLAAGRYEVAGVLDDDPACRGTLVGGTEVCGDASQETLVRFGVERAVIAVGSNRAARRSPRGTPAGSPG